jgi:hypothetical protein
MINDMPSRDAVDTSQVIHTFTTLDGQVLDLSQLAAAEHAFFAQRLAAYSAGEEWETFARMARTLNPVILAAGGRITQSVWDHPLFQAVHDLEDRLGILQGEILPSPGDDVDRDPLKDTWIPAVTAAAQKGVSLPGLHGAIKRGEVLARREATGNNHVLVSANSLARWAPDRVRQGARAGATRALSS